MLVKDIKIKKIEKLLQSLPDDLIIDSIDLTNGYEIKLTASLKEQDNTMDNTSLKELYRIIKKLEKG